LATGVNEVLENERKALDTYGLYDSSQIPLTTLTMLAAALNIPETKALRQGGDESAKLLWRSRGQKVFFRSPWLPLHRRFTGRAG
jgi:hypothetical protein